MALAHILCLSVIVPLFILVSLRIRRLGTLLCSSDYRSMGTPIAHVFKEPFEVGRQIGPKRKSGPLGHSYGCNADNNIMISINFVAKISYPCTTTGSLCEFSLPVFECKFIRYIRNRKQFTMSPFDYRTSKQSARIACRSRS